MTLTKWLLGFSIVFVAICTMFMIRNTSSSSSVDRALITTGIEVYRANYCGACHTLAIANTRGNFGPNHDTIIEDARTIISSVNYVGSATTVEEYIFESIVQPDIFYTPGYEASNHHMPTFAHLPEDNINAMVYLLTNQDAVQSPE